MATWFGLFYSKFCFEWLKIKHFEMFNSLLQLLDVQTEVGGRKASVVLLKGQLAAENNQTAAL